jgi:hypothetical protein
MGMAIGFPGLRCASPQGFIPPSASVILARPKRVIRQPLFLHENSYPWRWIFGLAEAGSDLIASLPEQFCHLREAIPVLT